MPAHQEVVHHGHVVEQPQVLEGPSHAECGDLVRRDGEGLYYFVARQKDIIRKRGENIAGAELDRVIGEHPGVALAAAIAVPDELGEDEILVAVVRETGATLEADEEMGITWMVVPTSGTSDQG